jgi:aminoglycoside phosphotransferase (APT) family kinase protein
MSEHFSGTKPVDPRYGFEAGALARWMKENVEGFSGDLAVEQFKGGQSNPTFLLRAGGKAYVLRRKPPGKLLPSAHAVDREFKVISALAKTDVPVAKAHALCQDDAVIGSAFYIMDFVQGRVFWDPSLPGLDNAERAAVYDDLNRAIAALHSVDYKAVGLADFGRQGAYVARQTDRWTKQYRASETERIEAMDNLIAWLPGNIPAADETAVVHGDYRLDNVICHPTEPRILAVLDWELSTLGHPLTDFAYHCMAWRLKPTEFRGIVGYDLVALGIPDEKGYVARYCQRAGRAGIPEKDWEFYMIFNMFRMAAILQGIKGRALQGTAASAQALEMGERARPLANLAWKAVENLLAGRA